MNGKRLNPDKLNLLRKEAVSLRLQKKSLDQVQQLTGLSHPTIIAAYRSFLKGGWDAVNVKSRGRPKGAALEQPDELKCIQLLLSPPAEDFHENQQLWSHKTFISCIEHSLSISISAKSASRYLDKWGFNPAIPIPCDTPPKQWLEQNFPDQLQLQNSKQGKIFIGGIAELNLNTGSQSPETKKGHIVFIRDLRGRLQWLASTTLSASCLIVECLRRLNKQHKNNDIQLFFKSYPLAGYPDIQQWLNSHKSLRLIPLGTPQSGTTSPVPGSTRQQLSSEKTYVNQSYVRNTMALTHLQRLEAESMQIMREVVTETENPVMLYSIGKDSAVMLHLAMKAFYPSKPPFPLLHVDTGWKFREMYKFRDQLVKDLGMELITHMNPEGVEKNINPFTHGSALHTDIMKTEGLKQALNKYGFDAAFGGARRDEEKSRAKERVFSFRTADHRWDPKNQRPELWKHYNAKKRQGESIRVFPLSNWTELDIWQYIHLEQIPIVPLYLSAERPVVERDGMLIMVDDERMPMNDGEVPMMKNVRFRTLGCYPLTGAVESDADTLPAVIQEMLLTKSSERQGRLIDHDSAASMEKKKQEGYF